VVGQS
jgi:hypothetical protein